MEFGLNLCSSVFVVIKCASSRLGVCVRIVYIVVFFISVFSVRCFFLECCVSWLVGILVEISFLMSFGVDLVWKFVVLYILGMLNMRFFVRCVLGHRMEVVFNLFCAVMF